MSQGYNEPSRSAVRESGGGSDIPVAVVRAAQAGDADALEAVVRGLYPLVSRWALVKTGSAQDAEDVTQETMIRVSKYINRFESRGKITTWAYQITSNAVADHYRRARRHLELLDEETDVESQQNEVPVRADAIRIWRRTSPSAAVVAPWRRRSSRGRSCWLRASGTSRPWATSTRCFLRSVGLLLSA
jgi:RNA polymerase sigma factor (sigma-70 family)